MGGRVLEYLIVFQIVESLTFKAWIETLSKVSCIWISALLIKLPSSIALVWLEWGRFQHWLLMKSPTFDIFEIPVIIRMRLPKFSIRAYDRTTNHAKKGSLIEDLLHNRHVLKYPALHSIFFFKATNKYCKTVYNGIGYNGLAKLNL